MALALKKTFMPSERLSKWILLLPVCEAEPLLDLVCGLPLLGGPLLDLGQLVVRPLDGLLGLGVSLVGVVQSDLHLVDVRLELLLDPIDSIKNNC